MSRLLRLNVCASIILIESVLFLSWVPLANAVESEQTPTMFRRGGTGISTTAF